jgi:hypothetical protein
LIPTPTWSCAEAGIAMASTPASIAIFINVFINGSLKVIVTIVI